MVVLGGGEQVTEGQYWGRGPGNGGAVWGGGRAVDGGAVLGSTLDQIVLRHIKLIKHSKSLIIILIFETVIWFSPYNPTDSAQLFFTSSLQHFLESFHSLHCAFSPGYDSSQHHALVGLDML